MDVVTLGVIIASSAALLGILIGYAVLAKIIYDAIRHREWMWAGTVAMLALFGIAGIIMTAIAIYMDG